MQDPTPEQVEAFRAAWHEADAKGDAGNRVRRGLAAALSAHHPKSDDVRRVEAQRDTQKTKARRARRARDKWQAACETATANAQMWMDEAVTQRQRSDSMEQRAEAAGRELAAANDELGRLRDSLGEWDGGAARQQMQAWDRLASHPFFADCYKMPDGSLIDAMLERLDDAIKPLVSYYDICETLRGTMSGFVATLGESIIHDAADAVWVLLDPNAEPAPVPDPVEAKARELYEAARPVTTVTWGDLFAEAKEPYRRMARHVLGADDE